MDAVRRPEVGSVNGVHIPHRPQLLLTLNFFIGGMGRVRLCFSETEPALRSSFYLEREILQLAIAFDLKNDRITRFEGTERRLQL
jgi:hypothetical protein